MPHRPQRRHALASFLNGRIAPGPDHPGMQLEIHPDHGYLNLRGDPGDEQFLQAVQATLGQPLPTIANTFTASTQRGRISNPSPSPTSSHTIFWLGPDEWLLVTGPGKENGKAEQLGKSLSGQCHSLVDVTGGQILLRLRGSQARKVLAKGCTLDLHPRAFKVGQCAQTTLAKTSMLIAQVDNTPTFDIIVRRSFAEYAALWLHYSGAGAM
ncbi:MAG: sarcosine oxidase subunit gamma [Gammaproteobacteria bacterium]|nr:sarcosine oxidase subunit gamma [Gammaproteobacteria bacterium]